MCVYARSACISPVVARLYDVGVWVLVLAFTLPILVGVCFCVRSACTPPVLDGVCGVGVCASVQVSAAPRHSWLRCWGVYVGTRSACIRPILARVYNMCVLVFVLAFTPPLLVGVFGWCVFVRVLPVPRQSWLGYALWVCAPVVGFRLRPAILFWAIGVCVCLCACSACTPPILAGVCGVGVLVRVLASTPPIEARVFGCVFLCAGSACILPILAWVSGPGVFAAVRVCCAPPSRAGVSECVCLCARSARPPPVLAELYAADVRV